MTSATAAHEHRDGPAHGHGHAHPEPSAVGRARGGRAWVAPVSVGAAALAGCVLVGLLQRDEAGPTTCPFRAITGLDCPGCGMTRGLSAFVRGRPGTAADFNLLLIASLPLVAYAYLVWLAAAFGRRLPVPRPGRGTYLVVGALAVAFSVVRNLPIGIGRYLNSDPAR
ncbi:MAG: DUF2752 domain-containing protein [Acidimicrobiia bacterium]